MASFCLAFVVKSARVPGLEGGLTNLGNANILRALAPPLANFSNVVLDYADKVEGAGTLI